MGKLAKLALKEYQKDIPKEQHVEDIDQLPPNKKHWLLWLALELLYKLISKKVSSNKKSK